MNGTDDLRPGPAADEADAAARGLPPGTLLEGRYEVKALLDADGAGGVGAVYRVHDRDSGRDVALEVLLPSLFARPEVARRFGHAAGVARELVHERIARVLEAGVDRETGLRFFTREILEGLTLRQWLDERKWLGEAVKPEAALEIARQILEALAHAHGKTIRHGDLRPENVLIVPGARLAIQVLGFGIASLREAAGPAPTGVPSGAAAYVAPELRAGGAGADARADARADLFSAAAILQELLTGEPPTGRSRKPGEGRADLPPELDELVLAGLEAAPEWRPPSAGAFLDDLAKVRALVDRRRGLARPGGRRRALAAGGALALVLLGAAAAGAWRAGYFGPGRDRPAEERAAPAEALLRDDPTRIALEPGEVYCGVADSTELTVVLDLAGTQALHPEAARKGLGGLAIAAPEGAPYEVLEVRFPPSTRSVDLGGGPVPVYEGEVALKALIRVRPGAPARAETGIRASYPIRAVPAAGASGAPFAPHERLVAFEIVVRPVDDVAGALADLAGEVERLKEAVAGAARAPESTDLAALRGAGESARRRLDRVRTRMQTGARRLAERLPEEAAAIDRALEELRKRAVEDDLVALEDELARGAPFSALLEADEALADLRAVGERLRRAPGPLDATVGELEAVIERQKESAREVLRLEEERARAERLARKDRLALRKLADEAEDLARRSAAVEELLRVQLGAVVLPALLAWVRVDLEEVARGLRQDDTGISVRDLQMEVLRNLVRTKAELERAVDVRGEGRDAALRRVELKVLAKIQEDLLKGTERWVMDIRLAGQAPGAFQRRWLARLASQQGNVADLVRKLAETAPALAALVADAEAAESALVDVDTGDWTAAEERGLADARRRQSAVLSGLERAAAAPGR